MRPTKLKKRANETRQEKPKKLNPNLLKPQNEKLIWQRFYSPDNALCCDFTMHTLLKLIYRKDISRYWYYVVYTYLPHMTWTSLSAKQANNADADADAAVSFLSFGLFFGNIFFLSSLFWVFVFLKWFYFIFVI